MSVANTHYGYEAIGKMMANAKKVFFIGIGGISMSSLAAMTKKRGYEVAGSDRTRTALTESLEGQGIDVVYEHTGGAVADADVVVYTVAIAPDNADYVTAKENGIPCISRADYLGYLMMGFSVRVGISGTHGKSSTTAMCADILMQAQTDPTILCGAEVPSIGGAYCCGDNDSFIVFEACEYQDSFLDFYPNMAVVLNMELDHVDYFSSIDQVRNSFSVFADKCGEDGYVIANADDENCMKAFANTRSRLVTFGLSEEADFRAVNISTERGFPTFDVFYGGEMLSRGIRLFVSGEHSIYNALSAFAACFLCGIDVEDIKAGLASFRGAHRRSEFVGKVNGADVFDDYGHHPTEVRTTLDGFRSRGYNKLYCVFQPHTYSRTRGFMAELCSSFDAVDEVVFADIYAARETDTLGMSASLLAEQTPRGKYVGSMSDICEYLKGVLCEGDAAIIMGAGDINKLFPMLGLDYKI